MKHRRMTWTDWSRRNPAWVAAVLASILRDCGGHAFVEELELRAPVPSMIVEELEDGSVRVQILHPEEPRP